MMFFGFTIIFQVDRMSAHVSSPWPSCHLIPCRSLYLIVKPSLDTSPFSSVGISLTASGTGLAWSSYRTAYENKNDDSSSVGVADAKAGLRPFGFEIVERTSRSACGPDGPFAPPLGDVATVSPTLVHALRASASARAGAIRRYISAWPPGRERGACRIRGRHPRRTDRAGGPGPSKS